MDMNHFNCIRFEQSFCVQSALQTLQQEKIMKFH